MGTNNCCCKKNEGTELDLDNNKEKNYQFDELDENMKALLYKTLLNQNNNNSNINIFNINQDMIQSGVFPQIDNLVISGNGANIPTTSVNSINVQNQRISNSNLDKQSILKCK